MSKRNRNHRPTSQSVIIPKALVDIVIPVHNKFDLLEKCLNALPEAADGIEYNVFIFDNGSDPSGKVKAYTQLPPRVYVIENSSNIGYPKACNLGAKVGNSPLILQLNDDVILFPGALKQLCLEMDDPTVGVCGVKLQFPNDCGELDPRKRPPGKLQHICLSIDIRGVVYHPFIGWNVDHPKVDKLRDVWAVTGAALMTRRHLWTKIGGYDEDFSPGTFEDAAYCMSIRDLGYNIITCSKAQGIHYTGATAESYKLAYPLRQNYMTFMSKWGSKIVWQDWKIL